MWHCASSTRLRKGKCFGSFLPSSDLEILLFVYVSLYVIHNSKRGEWGQGLRRTSGKKVVTTVLSANLRPASSCNAFLHDSVVSNCTKILPTPADCLLPPLGRGIFSPIIFPNLPHSSRTSSQISGSEKSVLKSWRVRVVSNYLRSHHCPSALQPSPC